MAFNGSGIFAVAAAVSGMVEPSGNAQGPDAHMADPGLKGPSSSNPETLPEDQYGVSWGELLPSPVSTDEKLKYIKQYSSFNLEGNKYALHDHVYLKAADGPPYIARILSLYENLKTEEKHMLVRWFCRPSDLPIGLPDVDYSENSKEIFLQWGANSKNQTNPASTIRQCTVLCTAKEWYAEFPSKEKIDAADHTFDRMYDATTQKVRSLDVVVNQFGEYYITGIGRPSRGYVKSSGGSEKLLLGAGKKSLANGIPPSHRPPTPAIRRGAHTASLKVDSNAAEGRTEKIASRSSPSALQLASQRHKVAKVSSAKTAEEGTTSQAAQQSSDTSSLKPVGKDITLDSKKRPRLDRSDTFSSQKTREGLVGAKFASPGVAEEGTKLPTEHSAPDPQKKSRVDMSYQESHKGKSLDPSSKHKNLEAKKRPRVDSDSETETGKFKKPKLKDSSHNLPTEPSAVMRKLAKPLENGSKSMSIDPKLNEVKSPKSVVDSLVDPSAVRKPLSSGPRAGSSFVDQRHGEVSFSREASKKTLGAELDTRGQKSKPVTGTETASIKGQTRGSETKSTKGHPELGSEGLQSNKVRYPDKSRLTGSPRVQVEETTIVDARKETIATSFQAARGVTGDNSIQDRVRAGKPGLSPVVSGDKLQKPLKKIDHGNEIASIRNRSAPNHDRTAGPPGKPGLALRGVGDKIRKPLQIERGNKPAAVKNGPASIRDHAGSPSGKDRRMLDEPKKKIFNLPWHACLESALQQKKALHLQNLDPWFSSSEIEQMLEDLLKVSCDVRMLPPKNFSCYTSGEALVLFRTHDAAQEALTMLTENILIWSKDGRPVIASAVKEQRLRTTSNHGFFNLDKFAPKGHDLAKIAVATSHCSQPNTVEYEMGLQWRLLQDQHTQAWTIAAQDYEQALEISDLASKFGHQKKG